MTILPQEYNSQLRSLVRNKALSLLIISLIGIGVSIGFFIVTVRSGMKAGRIMYVDSTTGAMMLFLVMLVVSIVMFVIAVSSFVSVRKSKTEHKCKIYPLVSKERLRDFNSGDIRGFLLCFEDKYHSLIQAEPYAESVWYFARTGDKFYVVTIGFSHYAFEFKTEDKG